MSNQVFARRELIKSLTALSFLSIWSRPALGTDESEASIAQLTDELTMVDSSTLGIDSAAMYDGFMAEDSPGEFMGGVLGVAAPSIPKQMRELVRRGPLALPALIMHLDDKRPTRLEVGNKDSGGSSNQVGVDTFRFTFFSDEYDPRLRKFDVRKGTMRRPRPKEKDFNGRYTVKLGDTCFVLIGQVVNRRLLAVRYQASGGLVVNSPIEMPMLAQRVREDWGQGDSEALKASLLSDVHANYVPRSNDYAWLKTEIVHSALKRLRLYFPDVYKTLEGDDLKKRNDFEMQEVKHT